jgi:hypothetical protein
MVIFYYQGLTTLGEHGPKVSVTSEYIVLQRVLQKRGCMSILTRSLNKCGILFQVVG